MVEILRISADAYHADPSPVPSLSASIAKTLLAKTPAHAWLEHPKLGGKAKAATKALDEGSIIDAILLGGWEKKLGVVDAKDYRTDAAKAARDTFRNEGRTPVLVHEVAEFQRVAKILGDKLDARGFHLTGESQVTILWEEETLLGPIRCRAMLDHVFIEDGVIYDLKKIHTASPRVIARQAFDLGYDVQRAAYVRALDKAMTAKRFGGPDFVFLFCETEPPYCVTPSRMDGTFRQLGEQRWERACQTWARCIRDNEWPEYTDTAIHIEPPGWAMAQELGTIA